MGKHSTRNNKAAISIAIILVLAAVACAVYFFPRNNTQEDNNTSSKEQISTSSVYNGAVNELTGLPIKDDYINKRPISIMINNIKQAQPLEGVSKADIMYECPVEGGITRILAVFKDPREVSKIGSVRSARPYFITLARGLDAFYMHIGSSTEAQAILKTGVVDDFDLGHHSGMMWRDAERRKTKAIEHTAVTSGERLIAGINKAKKRTTVKSSYSYPQQFGDNSQILNASDTKAATNIKVTFSSYKNTIFKYDSANKTYRISQYNAPQMDNNAGIQNSKPNVLVIKVKTYEIDAKSGKKAMEFVGSGTGYYISNGKIMDIKWRKSSADTPLVYSTASGENLVMCPGQIYVCCIPLSGTVSVE